MTKFSRLTIYSCSAYALSILAVLFRTTGQGQAMKTIVALAAAMTMLVAAAPAQAAPPISYTFNTVGNTAVNGTYGNAIGFDTTSPSTLKLSVTAWQSNLVTNAITSAYLGAYSGGLGVTGIGDANGAGGLHQIDNVGGYTDFVMLEFNRPVTLRSITTNSYGINGVYDNDAAWADASVFTTPTWNSTAGFTNYSTVPDLWSPIANGGSGTARVAGAATSSTKWLVGAAFLPFFDRDDGFKIASISVSEAVTAVPEPASWAMMIVGFGAIGGALRRTRQRAPAAAAA